MLWEIALCIGEVNQSIGLQVLAVDPVENWPEIRTTAALDLLFKFEFFPGLEKIRTGVGDLHIAAQQGDARPHLTLDGIDLGKNCVISDSRIEPLVSTAITSSISSLRSPGNTAGPPRRVEGRV